MNEFLNKVAAVFTPSRRKKIYHLTLAVTSVLALHGVITADEASEYLLAVSYVLFGGVAQLAAANTPSDGDDE